MSLKHKKSQRNISTTKIFSTKGQPENVVTNLHLSPFFRKVVKATVFVVEEKYFLEIILVLTFGIFP
jgi:hypothetical protein